MRQFRKTTIKDVAVLAGVSTSTVSYFVSGREDVCSPQTGHRIRKAVETLNYTPNFLSTGMRRKSTRTLGLHMIAPLAIPETDGSFFLERLWRGVMRQADASDYSILHYPASVRDGASSDALLDGRVDGLPVHSYDDTRLARVASAGMPTVVITRGNGVPAGCGAVWADESSTIGLALSHLWDLGHRRIGFVAGPIGDPEAGGDISDIAMGRHLGFREWMTARDAFDAALVGHAAGWDARNAESLIAAWMGDAVPPTAVVCTNDAQALDVAAAASAAGLSVPDDLSIVGVDNSPHARDRRPHLTSVDIPLEEVGAESVQALLRLMQGAPMDECRVAVPVTNLMIRDSTAPPRIGGKRRPAG